jgi:LacI family transcriptional regulator
VPADLGVIGYDNLPLVMDITPALPTVVHPVGDLARLATRLLIDILERRCAEPVQKWLDTDFVVRQLHSVLEIMDFLR